MATHHIFFFQNGDVLLRHNDSVAASDSIEVNWKVINVIDCATSESCLHAWKVDCPHIFGLDIIYINNMSKVHFDFILQK